MKLNKGSFRDRTAQIFYYEKNIYRGLTESAANEFKQFSTTNTYSSLIESKKLIGTQVDSLIPESVINDKWVMVLQHQIIPFITYPYEWSNSMLKDSALLQLEIMQELLLDGYILKDGSAYNIQWQGVTPIFIDISSIVKYSGHGLWFGYRQFCQHFLYPLMLAAYRSINSSILLRGDLNGIEPAQCKKMLGIGSLFKKGVFSHVILQAFSKQNPNLQNKKISKLSLPESNLRKIILKNTQGLIDVIKDLNFTDASNWSDYGETHSYNRDDIRTKDDFIRSVSDYKYWGTVWDIGCNNGRFAKILAEKAKYVIAIDSDHATVNNLYQNLKQSKVSNILPLCMNLTNPSPSQGWNNNERDAFTRRGKPQLIIALALIHHIVITEQIPLNYFIDWLKENSSFIVIEFVDITDPMVELLSQAKDESVPDYNKNYFEAELQKHFTIIKKQTFNDSLRYLYFCEKRS